MAAGIGNENIHRPEPTMNLRKRAANRVRIGGICLHDEAPEIIRNGAQRLRTAAHDRHVGALGHEAARDGSANAGSTPGNKRGFS